LRRCGRARRIVKDRNLKAGKDFYELVTTNVTNSKGGPQPVAHFLPKATAVAIGATFLK
jgi:hypothetical protein